MYKTLDLADKFDENEDTDHSIYNLFLNSVKENGIQELTDFMACEIEQAYDGLSYMMAE